jgi:hypothetical protein
MSAHDTPAHAVTMHPHHEITVTPGPIGRAFFECTCGDSVRALPEHNTDGGSAS